MEGDERSSLHQKYTVANYCITLCKSVVQYSKKKINYCAISTIIFYVRWRSKCL